MSEVSERLNPLSRSIDTKTVAEVIEIINNEDSLVASAVTLALLDVQKAIELIISTLKGGGCVFLVGAGTSGRLCVLEAAEIPPTFGLSAKSFQAVIAGGHEAVFRSVETAEDDVEDASEDLARLGLRETDLVVGVSASGSTLYVLGAMTYARNMGANTIGIANNKDTPLSELVDVAIEVVVGPEVVAGSTRMKAGTAQKMVLNMMTTAAMVKLGLVYDGYMVGVQASNNKLIERSIRILTEITGVNRKKAEGLIKSAQGDVRVAILLASTNMTPNEARSSLNGWTSLRKILETRGTDV